MALAGRMRSSLPLLHKILRSQSVLTQRSVLQQSSERPRPGFPTSEFSRNYATETASKEVKVKVPLPMFGAFGTYASALYISATKANVLDKVESEVLDFVEASKRSPTFSQFMKDLSVPEGTRVNAMDEICSEAKFSTITRNFLVILTEQGGLRYVENIAKKFVELTMAYRGEVKVTVTTVIPLPPEEEKQLNETLLEIVGRGKKVKVEQKIDPSILGGLVVEFGQKLFDMSIRTRAKQMERFLREPVNFDSI